MKIGKDYIGVGGGVLIFNEKGKILLTKRGAKSKNEIGVWSKPGGEIDFGEKAEDAIKREILEETNLEVEFCGLLPHTDHIIKKDKQHWVAINYIGKADSSKLKNMEPDKCEKLEWFDIDNLPDKIAQTTKEAVENYLKGKYINI